jgi:hypothetical protein
VKLASPLSIVLVNQSTVVTDTAVAACAKALNTQLNRDFAPYWGIDGTVIAAKSAPAGGLPVYVLDDSDQAGALGYHDNDPQKGPFGRVFARTDAKYKLNWTITTSHEVLELAADPFAVSTAQVNASTFTALEVCDAVESDSDGYQIDGVWVSDFVTPAWFGTGTGPYDYRKLLARPFALRKGGYMSVWTAGRGWGQKTASAVPGVTSRSQFAHRRLVKARHQQTAHVEIIEQAT